MIAHNTYNKTFYYHIHNYIYTIIIYPGRSVKNTEVNLVTHTHIHTHIHSRVLHIILLYVCVHVRVCSPLVWRYRSAGGEKKNYYKKKKTTISKTGFVYNKYE